jgi:hypothetical protein
MKKTFWLYYGKLLVTSVLMPADTTETQIIQHAVDNQRKSPTVSHLWPERDNGTIQWLICHSRVEA